MRKVLFVCSRNKLRSPTAEQIFSSYAGLDVSSAGLDHDAQCPLTPELLEWADVVFVMEQAHRSKLQKRFRASLNGKKVVCLGIPDDYEYMDARLVALLESKVPQFLPSTCVKGRPE